MRSLRVAAGAWAVVMSLVLVGSAPTSSSARPSVSAAPVTLSVMTLNIFYGGDDFDLGSGDWCSRGDGCPEGLRKLADYVVASGADVVGVQEAERNTRALARLLGWHADPRAQVISRFPLLKPSGGQGLYTFVEPVPGRIVAVANTHLPSTPYGPYKVQRGWTRREVIDLELRTRMPTARQVLRLLPRLAARGIPVFLTGDFNSPSHLDWTPAVADARADVAYPVDWPVSRAFAETGFTDSYRAVHPDPVADPGYTWTPGGPEAREDDVFDRIDWVLSAGPATAVDSRLVGETGNPQVDVALPGRFPSDHRGVVSTFEVEPAAAPTMVSPGTRRVLTGGNGRLRVHFTGAGPRHVVALVRAGSDGLLRATATGQRTRGAVGLPTRRLRPGKYDVVLADAANGRIAARSPVWVYDRGTKATVATSKAAYAVGEPVRVRWTAAPGQHLDWIGLFRCRQSCSGPGGYLMYRYTRTAIEGQVTFRDGVFLGEGVETWPLPPGEYVARLLVDDSYRVRGTSARFRIAR